MKKIIIIDSIIVGLGIFVINKMYQSDVDKNMKEIYLLFFFIIAIIILIDLLGIVIKYINRQKTHSKPQKIDSMVEKLDGITRILLLNEEEVPIREWELLGKTSLLIGRENKEEQVDIDLEECEYSALVDSTHAILNYASGEWFVEDLYSTNGISIQKRQDNCCYKLAKDRPCKLTKGDIVHIANTKLWLQ